MRLSIIIIGDEILLGQVTDTNSGAIARAFGPEGWEVEQVKVIGDDAKAIRSAVENAMKSANMVITTGGLGPTKDDITKKVLTEIFGGTLWRDPEVTTNIENVFSLRGLKMNALTADQALVPTSCRVIQNRYGTAPIMWFEQEGKVLVSMPGVPFETEGMLPEVLRQAQARFSKDKAFLHHTIMVTGITESALAQHLESFENSLPDNMHLAYLPTPGLIRLRLDGSGKPGEELKNEFAKTVEALKKELASIKWWDGDKSAAAILLNELKRLNLKVASAESCTGGNIAHAITSIPGSSESYVGSIVSYSNDVKIALLGVEPEKLEKYGAVSREVVEQMAIGACTATGADCSIATSGIAGPDGGTPDKPVGTVWIGWHCYGHTHSRLVKLPGNRSRVIDRATTEAILSLVLSLAESD